MSDLNRIYEPESALWEVDGEAEGFEWIDVNNSSENIVAFLRRSKDTSREIICVCNFSAVPRKAYHVERLSNADYDLILNTAAEVYGGSDGVSISASAIHLPPLTTLWFAPRKATKKIQPQKGTKSTKKKNPAPSAPKSDSSLAPVCCSDHVNVLHGDEDIDSTKLSF